jgi:hypothetical protein
VAYSSLVLRRQHLVEMLVVAFRRANFSNQTCWDVVRDNRNELREAYETGRRR